MHQSLRLATLTQVTVGCSSVPLCMSIRSCRSLQLTVEMSVASRHSVWQCRNNNKTTARAVASCTGCDICKQRHCMCISICICIITLTSRQCCVGRLAGRNLMRCNLADNQRHAARIYDAAAPSKWACYVNLIKQQIDMGREHISKSVSARIAAH